MVGAANGAYQLPHEWETSLSFRTLRSDTHYKLDQEQVQRHELGTYVINHQNLVDLSVAYAPNRRWVIEGGIPFSVASWSIPTPTSPVPGPRAQEDAHGIGDISVLARRWMFHPSRYKNGNLAIGAGLKIPTGDYKVMDAFPDATGHNTQPRVVDQSIQPGDGGWGIMLEAQGFRSFRRMQVFGSGNYLVNPKDTNGAPSLTVSRLPPGVPPPANSDRLVNSVPDQYLARIGAGTWLGKNMIVSAAYRVEGQRRYDLIGASHGFRRPGVEMFLEPGLSYGVRNGNVSVSVPIAFYRNRKPDPYTGLQGDATFPNFIFLATYSYRFGAANQKQPPVRTNTTPPDSDHCQ